MKYLAIIEKAEKNFAAYVPDLPGCVSTGETMAETLTNIREAIEGHLEIMHEYGGPIPEPTSEAVQVEVKMT